MYRCVFLAALVSIASAAFAQQGFSDQPAEITLYAGPELLSVRGTFFRSDPPNPAIAEEHDAFDVGVALLAEFRYMQFLVGSFNVVYFVQSASLAIAGGARAYATPLNVGAYFHAAFGAYYLELGGAYHPQSYTETGVGFNLVFLENLRVDASIRTPVHPLMQALFIDIRVGYDLPAL